MVNVEAVAAELDAVVGEAVDNETFLELVDRIVAWRERGEGWWVGVATEEAQ